MVKAKGSITKQEIEIEASREEAEAFLKGIVPKTIKNAGGVISDKVAVWRFERQVDLVLKAKKKIEESGLEMSEVPIKILVPILGDASLEDDFSLQEKWTNLLANAATSKYDIRPTYVEMLKELNPLEVKILDVMYDELQKSDKSKSIQFSKSKIKATFSLSDEDADLVVENFLRLNLCRPPAGEGIQVGDLRFALATTEIFEITSLGAYFIRACRWDT